MTELILLGAGASRRFGGQKLLAEFQGKPLYQWAFEAAGAAGAPVTVVTRAGLLDKAGAEHGFQVALVEDGLPQSASVAAGAARARPGSDLCFFVCDQPHFPGWALADFIKGFSASGARLGRVRAGAQPGSPCIFSGSLRERLLELSGDQGGHTLFQTNEQIYTMEVPALFLRDYDSPWS